MPINVKRSSIARDWWIPNDAFKMRKGALLLMTTDESSVAINGG